MKKIKIVSTKYLSIILLCFICFGLVISAYPNLIQITGASVPKAVSVIDSIVVTEYSDPSVILAEWSVLDPEITVNKDFTSQKATKLFINFSDSNGTIDLNKGDYFTFIIPSVFDHRYVYNETDVEMKDGYGNVVATYSIYTNGMGLKEVKITFTDYVEEHTHISGDFWCLLFVGSVDSSETANIEFVINNQLTAAGEVTVNPDKDPGHLTRPEEYSKTGYCMPELNANGYYIFEWIVYLNMNEGPGNTGFNVIENFSFSDTIPTDSPHVFLTDELRQKLGLSSSKYRATISEYIGSDSEYPADRYQSFLTRYNDYDSEYWLNNVFLDRNQMVNGLTTTGIDGQNGLNVTQMQVSDKSFSANLGVLTRPSFIIYYTVSTIKLSESALADEDVVKFFENRFEGSAGQNVSTSVAAYNFTSGGSAHGIQGDYSFTFEKVDENGGLVQGALFSLYINEEFTGGADRFAFSGSDGVVRFENLPVGVYYFKETFAPAGFILNNTIYKVVIDSQGYEIFYGDNYQNELSTSGNQIINKREDETPAETQTTTPVQTQTTVPTQTQTTAPAQTETTAPAETETTIPAQTETTAPAETETTIPAQTETTAPAETETTIPTQTQPTTPSETQTTAPAQTQPATPADGTDVDTGDDGIMAPMIGLFAGLLLTMVILFIKIKTKLNKDR